MKHDLGNLKRAIAAVEAANFEELTDPAWLTKVLLSVGLTKDDVRNQGVLDRQIDDTELGGINQTLEQFVPALLLLSKQRIRTIIDIGTWCGWSIAFVVAYLRRFNGAVLAHTVDRSSVRSVEVRTDPVLSALPITWWNFNSVIDPVPEGMPTSADLVMIDAGHAYSAAWSDWVRFGAQSRCVFFHDVNDDPIADGLAPIPSVKRLWQELKQDASVEGTKVELFDHPSGKNLMGIGLILR